MLRAESYKSHINNNNNENKTKSHISVYHDRPKMLIKEYKLSITRWINSGDLIYSMVTTLNDTVLYTSKLTVRWEFSYSHHDNNKVAIIWGKGQGN